MLKKHMAASLVATAFAATPALAQSTVPGPSGATDRPAASGSGAPTSGSPAMAPGAGAPTSGSGATTSGSGSATSGSSTTMPSSASSAMSTASGSSGTFMTEQRPGQWLASKLIGTTVVSANNESIGDVNDVVMERDGKVAAVIIGVGGFLGIGEKDVAVPFSQIELTSRAAASATAGTAGTAPAGTAGTPGTAMPGTAMNGTAGTASTSGTVGTTMSGTGAGANMASNPDRIVLRMTKADLQNAPTFHNASRAGAATGTRSTTSGSPATGTGSSTTNKP